MIPYDDLVAALQSWRVRQGLPVSAGAVIAQQTAAPSAPAPGSGPRTAPPAPPRTNPPAAPGARAPMPLAAPEDSLDVDAANLLDEQVYENEGDDFALAFGKNQSDSAEATQIGDGTAEPTDPTGRGGKREDW